MSTHPRAILPPSVDEAPRRREVYVATKKTTTKAKKSVAKKPAVKAKTAAKTATAKAKRPALPVPTKRAEAGTQVAKVLTKASTATAPKAAKAKTAAPSSRAEAPLKAPKWDSAAREAARQRMKEYWASRKAVTVKPSKEAKQAKAKPTQRTARSTVSVGPSAVDREIAERNGERPARAR